jgi:drug/metabolite transporter (DMT)-like permease
MNQSLPRPINLNGFLVTFAGALLFSTKAIFVKKAFQATPVDAVTLLTLRMVFSLPFYLVAVWILRNEMRVAPLSVRQWWTILALGLLGYYLSSLFDFIGLQYISAGLERLILFLYPTFAVLLNRLLFKQSLSRNQQWALLLTYAGIAVAFWGEMRVETGSPLFWWGSFCVFVCAVTYSIYLVGSGRMIPLVGANRFTAYAMLSSTFGVFLHFLLAGGQGQVLTNEAVLPYGILLALVATVVPSFLLASGMKRIGSNNVAIISSIGPVSTILQAHFLLGEPIYMTQMAGSVLVITGIVMLGKTE